MRQGSSSRSRPVCDLSGSTLGGDKAVPGRSHRGHCLAHSNPGAQTVLPSSLPAPRSRTEEAELGPLAAPAHALCSETSWQTCTLLPLVYTGAWSEMSLSVSVFVLIPIYIPRGQTKPNVLNKQSTRRISRKGKCRECFSRGSECEQEAPPEKHTQLIETHLSR